MLQSPAAGLRDPSATVRDLTELGNVVDVVVVVVVDRCARAVVVDAVPPLEQDAMSRELVTSAIEANVIDRTDGAPPTRSLSIPERRPTRAVSPSS